MPKLFLYALSRLFLNLVPKEAQEVFTASFKLVTYIPYSEDVAVIIDSTHVCCCLMDMLGMLITKH